MNAAELKRWWKEDVRRESQKYERLKPKGAVASQLAFRLGDIKATLAHFEGERPRLEARYPAFWRGLQPLLTELRTELEIETVHALANELERIVEHDSDGVYVWCPGCSEDQQCEACEEHLADIHSGAVA